MQRILIITPDRSHLAEFARRIAENQDLQVAWAPDGQAAVADVMRYPPLAAVIDEILPDMPGLDLVRRLIQINALILTAVVSELAPDAFHEAAEGLGIMAQLPRVPAPADADAFVAGLKRLAPAPFR
jgi:DNA-binding response OmpR family regulator